MKRKKVTALISFILCLVLGISGLSVGIVKALEDTEERIELTTTDQVILDGDGSETVTSEEEALQYFEDHAANYGIADAKNTLVMQEPSEAAGYRYYSCTQTYHDIPVYGNCLNIMTDAQDGTVLMSTGVYRDIDEDVDLTAKATKEDIIASIEENFTKKGGYKAVSGVSVTETLPSEENLVIYSGEKKDVLAYEFDASFQADEEYMNYHMLADAKTGEILDGWSNIMTETVSLAADDKGMPKRSIWGKTKAATDPNKAIDIEVSYDESEQIYYLRDDEKNIKIYNIDNKNSIKKINDEEIVNVDIWNDYNQYGVKSPDENSWDINAVILLDGVERVYQRYGAFLGIEGFGEDDGEIIAGYNDSYDSGKNAYGGGFYPNKDGGVYTILSFGSKKDLTHIDLIAHEYGHSVMNYANFISQGFVLEYKGESGAIKEAYADTMGEIIEHSVKGTKEWNQSVGRNIASPNKSKNPSEIGDKFYQNPNVQNEKNDQGGRHHNSTVLSHASYLMTEVRDKNGKIVHEGMEEIDTARLWYDSIHMISYSSIGFQEFGWLMYRTAVAMSNTGELTSQDVIYVKNALKEVGIEFEQITMTVNYNFDCSIKDYYNSALDDAKVEFYEMNSLGQKENNKINDRVWNIEKKPVFTIESTDKEAHFKAEKLEKDGFYAVKITDNKNKKGKSKYIKIHCVTDNKRAEVEIDTEFRKDIVVDFSLSDEEIDLAVDEIKYIEPIIKPRGISPRYYSINWKSSDEDVVTVDKNGQFKGIAEGTATVTATLKNKGRTFTDEVTVTVTKKQRDTILVLDCSGSMRGEPMVQMKQAAVKFCEAMLSTGGDNRVEIIGYDNGTRKSGFLDNLSSLESYISGMGSGGGTDTYNAMKLAVSELAASARKSSVQNIVIMSDGVPNNGSSQSSGVMSDWAAANGQNAYAVEYGNGVCAYYDAHMKDGYDVYSLGFFHSLYDNEKAYCSYLMNYIQNSGYYEVEDADKLQISFGTISGQVNNGSKIVITVACPVDVTVSLNGETLSSSRVGYNDTTSFGTLKRTGAARDIKVLELDSANDYDITFEGTGEGTMDYAVTFYGADDSIEDTRSFAAVPVSASTKMASSTARTEEMQLQIDSDGDGQTDSIWTAQAGSDGKETFRDKNAITAEVTAAAADIEEKQEPKESSGSKAVWIVLIVCSSVVILTSMVCIVIVVVKKTPEEKQSTDRGKQNQNKWSVSVCAVVVMLDGSMKGKQIPFESGTVYAVGKDASKANVVIDQKFHNVSRLHCLIEFDAKHNGYYITDRSSNGTYLMSSKKRLEQGKRILIARNTVIYLARSDCRIELK